MTVNLAQLHGAPTLTFVLDTECVQVCSVLRGFFCFYIHRFQRTAHNVTDRCPVAGGAEIRRAFV